MTLPPFAAAWPERNRALLAKLIREFAYEESFTPQQDGDGWTLRLASGVTYRFQAVRGIWGSLTITPESLTRDGVTVTEALPFLLDAQAEFAAAPEVLAGYGRELLHTLLADSAVLARNAGQSAAALIALPDDDLQSYLDGHPKAPGSKGRLGWGLESLTAYAPEFGGRFQVVWAAAHRDACRWSAGADITPQGLLRASLSDPEVAAFDQRLRDQGLDPAQYLPLPIHPWQWQAMIAPAFAGEIAAQRLVPLGPLGDAYRPLQSLRTLANADRPRELHLKLALTVLNTSAWRGIPGKYLAIGPIVSDWLKGIVATDPELAEGRRVLVQGEPAGVFYPHPYYEALTDAPYQYREMLGAIWRESPALLPGESSAMVGALWHRVADGPPLACAWIAQSGLSTEEWLDALFEAVTVPLYHFLARYGVGFIAHGQNIGAVFRQGRPVGVTLKDFQGDMDLVDAPFPELDSLAPAARAALPRKPPLYVAHGLLTGHFVTSLRFLSEALREAAGFPEDRFYGLLAGVLRRYQTRHPDLAARFAEFDVFAPEIHRVCINRVRLAIGYGDAAQRPLPTLGTPLRNSLRLGLDAGLAGVPSVSPAVLDPVP
ncbi:aerobactin synthase IucC [Elstera cyanobacteriorum]|uniref:IucA/IucC family protein n=1 Tax=Elstera cyanobacteriorum TaxID=2022747 RepID=A0A255XM22_9PROT|nr:IucA/IucC family protein [Elstera cyanobacteriorum]OYQ17495.1 hypothetical protein CHR90_16245 [Elstera cyanobacteriorum]GFZ94372.1 aerobactin synthase IucC [Elstera cyanobacteriorum]